MLHSPIEADVLLFLKPLVESLQPFAKAKAHSVAFHLGRVGDILPSNRHINLPFVVTYTIENRKIISYWLVADPMALMEQLGVDQTLAG